MKEAVNCFLRRAPCTYASTAIRKCRIFILIKFTNIKLKNDALNVFMAFLEIDIPKKLSIASLVECPADRSI